MKIIEKIKSLSTTKKIVSFAVIVLILVGVYIIFKPSNENVDGNIYVVKRGNVVSEVSVTGTVKPVKNIDLAFERSGRIDSILVDVGDKVYNGEKLVILDNNDLYAQLAQAEATLSNERATLLKMEKGARPEEVKAKELALESARKRLDGYYSDAVNKIIDAYAKTDDGARNKIDALFVDDESDSPKLSFNTSEYQAKINSEFYRLKSRIALNEWKADVDSLDENSSDYYADIEFFIRKSEDRINVVLSLFSNLQDALNGAVGVSATTIETYKTNLNTARSNVLSALTSLDNIEQSIKEQKVAVSLAENDLVLTKNGATQEDIDAQKARVANAEAQVAYVKSQIEKTILRAPFDGTVTKISFEEGDIVQPNQPILSIIGGGKYQIETNIAESDISKVHIGDTAKVTLDAYGDNVIFGAKVMKIDIGATIIEGVATYKTTLMFDNADERILPGLTANIDILSGKRENVIYVPTRNIINKDGKSYVKKVDEDGNVVEIEIETGLRGSDGRTEVISGLKEGDKIISE